MYLIALNVSTELSVTDDVLVVHIGGSVAEKV